MEKFVYLVQSAGALPAIYDSIPCQRADLIRLTWEEPVDGATFLPKSSWSQRRNRLLNEVAERGGEYLYYVFVDGDLTFDRGGWRQFEEGLLKYRPAIATPYCPEYRPANHRRQDLDAHTCYSFDAMFNAFHFDVARDTIVLPYYGGFDHESWWYSQVCVIELAELLYPRHVLQLNSTAVRHAEPDANKRIGDLARMERWFRTQVLRPTVSARLARQALRVSRHVQSRLVDRRVAEDRRPVHPPSPPPATYRVPESLRRQLFNPDSVFWLRPSDPSARHFQARVTGRASEQINHGGTETRRGA